MRLRRLVSLFAGLLAVTLSPLSARAADVEFVRVWPGWRDAASFERISEYFTGREDTSGRTVLRTQPGMRDGFYFLVRVANAAAAQPGAKFVLHVITPASPDPITHTFAADLPARSTVFHLGLTGADWAGPDVHPVAWKLDLLTDTDQLLTSAQSYLWSKPAR